LDAELAVTAVAREAADAQRGEHGRHRELRDLHFGQGDLRLEVECAERFRIIHLALVGAQRVGEDSPQGTQLRERLGELWRPRRSLTARMTRGVADERLRARGGPRGNA